MITIVRYLIANPGSSGAQISQGARVGTARLYPALAKMERDGVITSEWEKPESLPDSHPRRRLYWVVPSDPVA